MEMRRSFRSCLNSAGDIAPNTGPSLTRSAAGTALELGYGSNTEKLVDGAGKLTGVRLHLPQAFQPVGKRIVVLFDMFPLYEETW